MTAGAGVAVTFAHADPDAELITEASPMVDTTASAATRNRERPEAGLASACVMNGRKPG